MEHITLENHLKKTTKAASVISGIIATLGSLAVVYGFYYNTKGTLIEHGEQIKEVETDVSIIKTKMADAAVMDGISNAEMKALQEKLNSVDKKVDKIDDKLDQILIKK